MDSPQTPLHPAPDQEISELPKSQLASDNLDLNPGLEDELSDEDASLQSGEGTLEVKDEEMRDSNLEVASWTANFDDAFEVERQKVFKNPHPDVTGSQQSKLVAYLDQELLQIQRKFVKNQAYTRQDYPLKNLLEDLGQVLDVLWVLISPRHDLFGQEEYFIKIAGDLEDWIGWYTFETSGVLEKKTEVFLFELFTFFQKLDIKISLLIDGLSETKTARLKLDRTQLVRLLPIIGRLRFLLIGKLRPIRDELARLSDNSDKQAAHLLNIVDVEVGRLLEGTLERS